MGGHTEISEQGSKGYLPRFAGSKALGARSAACRRVSVFLPGWLLDAFLLKFAREKTSVKKGPVLSSKSQRLQFG